MTRRGLSYHTKTSLISSVGAIVRDDCDYLKNVKLETEHIILLIHLKDI